MRVSKRVATFNALYHWLRNIFFFFFRFDATETPEALPSFVRRSGAFAL